MHTIIECMHSREDALMSDSDSVYVFEYKLHTQIDTQSVLAKFYDHIQSTTPLRCVLLFIIKNLSFSIFYWYTSLVIMIVCCIL